MAGGRLKNHAAERAMFARRAIVAGLGVIALIAILVTRMAYLQVEQHDYFSTRSDDNRMRVQVVPPVRGLVFDRNGVLMAENLPAYRLEIVPEQVEDMENTLNRLSKLVEIRELDLQRFHKRRRTEPKFRGVPLRFHLSQEEVARLEVNRQHFPGVSIVAGLTRSYPVGESAAHVLGYVGSISEREASQLEESRYRGTNYIGKVGVEYSYEDVLLGEPGSRITEANAAGRLLRELEYSPPTDGKNLYLTIDTQLQSAAEEAMGEEVGAVVAIEPDTGALLALVSTPTFAPQLFVEGISHKDYNALQKHPGRPLFNRALQGQYPPGSTIKPIMALAGLETGNVAPYKKVWCPGFYKLPNSTRRYRDWKRSGHGWINMFEAIFRSSDVYFYQLAVRLGIDTITEYGDRFNFGRKTGIDLPREKPGVMPSREWKRGHLGQMWYPGETLNSVIGQGYYSATPLQLAHAAALIGKRGKGFRPRVLHAIEDPASGNIEPAEPIPLEPIEIKNNNNWNHIIKAMEDVVHHPRGTGGRAGRDGPFRIAGKTGTSQVAGLKQDEARAPKLDEVPRHLRDHALFIAFAPKDNPKIAVAVLVEHGGGGGATAAPIAGKVMEAYLLPQMENDLEPPL